MTQAASSLPDSIHIFETVPDLYLIISPDLTILTASDAYLQATSKERGAIRGKHLLEVFPESAAQPKANASSKLRESLEWALQHKQRHQMPLLQYNTSESLAEKYWNSSNTPVLDSNGDVRYIIHRVEETTKQAESQQRIGQKQEKLQDLNRELEARVLSGTSARADPEIQRNQLYHLFMQAPAPICVLKGEDFIYELVNPAYQQLLPGRKLIGNSMLGVALSELANQPIAALLEQVYRSGETIEGKEELIPVASYEGGPLEDRYFNYTLQARRNELGLVDGIFIFVQEVTAQVEARKTAEHSATQLRLITDALPVLIGYLDKEEKYRFANKAYESWFAMKAHELLGRPVREVVGEKAYNGVKAYIDRALAGERLDFESRMPYREDFVKYIRTSYVPDVRNGKVEGFFTLVNDITDQVEVRQKIEQSEKEARALARELQTANDELSRSVKAYQRLAQQQQQLVALVENSTDFIGLASPDGRGVYINQAGLELVGLEEPQVTQVEVLDFFYEEDKAFVKQEILPTLLEKGRWAGEFRLCHFRTGVSIPIYYNCFSIKEPLTGQLLGLATIIIDISARKQQEAALQALTKKLAGTNEELREANAQLTRTNVDLDNFIYAASHDLKAPISNIEGLMQILMDAIPPQVLATKGLEEVTGMIWDSIERFKRTIEHLTEVTKLQKENNQDAVLVDISDVIRDVRLDLSSQLEEAGAQLELDIAGCTGIRFSEKNLRSVIYNLLSNAIKYKSPERTPHVRIQCRSAGEFNVLSVSDNGLGMNLPRRNKLFTMFGRLHDHVEGTGIGLYMVKKIVENTGGRIEVSSQVGTGSTFTVYFKS